jgi:hypothetical protein
MKGIDKDVRSCFMFSFFSKKFFFSKTISSVVSLFISTNVGTIGFCLLGLFTFLGEDSAFQSSSAAIYLLMGILLFVQS